MIGKLKIKISLMKSIITWELTLCRVMRDPHNNSLMLLLANILLILEDSLLLLKMRTIDRKVHSNSTVEDKVGLRMIVVSLINHRNHKYIYQE